MSRVLHPAWSLFVATALCSGCALEVDEFGAVHGELDELPVIDGIVEELDRPVCVGHGDPFPVAEDLPVIDGEPDCEAVDAICDEVAAACAGGTDETGTDEAGTDATPEPVDTPPEAESDGDWAGSGIVLDRESLLGSDTYRAARSACQHIFADGGCYSRTVPRAALNE